ncbi:MAG TPA: 6-carboxytetrahydropterin synthase QueD [Chloroflexi bacterium]|nr:6-carboxytetrahydropterin synthase QueD [Chloroflexota bacterium]
MYEVTVLRHFDAAHSLRNYHGKCEKLHGHRYQVAVSVKSGTLDETGLAFDFTKLKKVLDEKIISRLDHDNLNEIPPFDRINPSAENIARFIYEELKKYLPGIEISRVRVWESPDAWVTFYPEEA